MKIGIITGASSGIGKEFVIQVSQKETLDEIWVIARRKERLEELRTLIQTPLRILALDLTKQESIEEVQALLQKESPDLRILVNASGFAKFGTYRDLSLEEVNGMIDLNCKAAVDLTQISLPYMGHGARILEICSAAGFQPLPGINVYAATKAFLISYTRALRWELIGRGITATAVCPQWVKTEFMAVGQDTQNGKTVNHFLRLAANPKHVVACALFDNAIGLPIAAFGPFGLFHLACAKFIPHFIIIAAWELLRRV